MTDNNNIENAYSLLKGVPFGVYLGQQERTNELDERISKLKLPPPRYNSGVLYKYSKLVSGSDKGAVTN